MEFILKSKGENKVVVKNNRQGNGYVGHIAYPIKHIVNGNMDILPIKHIATRKLKIAKTKKNVSQFHLAYI